MEPELLVMPRVEPEPLIIPCIELEPLIVPVPDPLIPPELPDIPDATLMPGIELESLLEA